MTTEPFFSERTNPLMWSGEASEVEAFGYSDGELAVGIGLGVVLAATVSALVISVFFTLGVMSR